ncbi:MAG TPA: glutathione S-transferase family protein [Roseiarcus sp.]|nr:glutathione S-transferase family protein [Roseiarcus sp.]
MGVLIDGQWTDNEEAPRRGGAFIRPAAAFRAFVAADGGSPFPAEAGRYHLYVANPCPWCHRTMIFRALKRLENVVSISFVDPLMLEGGWAFKEPDPITGARFVHELYTRADPHYTGRVSVPVLWDKKTGRIVNNESSEIIRMFNSAFEAFTDERTDYYPATLRPEIDAINTRVYETVNNGVYRCGFAKDQKIYETAVTELFETLACLEARLARNRYLLGDTPTEADWRLFPTLFRFDAVYYGLFKCNLRHVYEHPALWSYARALYQTPGVAETCDIAQCKLHYYGSLRMINPNGIVPKGPMLDFGLPHDRD